MKRAPDGLPRYRLLTGPDDDKFCRRVSEALDLGYRLYGSPAITFDGKTPVVAQAIVWPDGDGAALESPGPVSASRGAAGASAVPGPAGRE